MFTRRLSQDLNGTWKFCPDPMQRCRQQQWWRNIPSPNSFFPCWDMQGLWDIEVPGTWKTAYPELTWYDGHATYVRDFTVPEIPDGYEAFLSFDSVVYASEVYLNGLPVAKRDWGYAPFVCRVTEMLQKENRLFVLVDNHLSAERVPGTRFDWNNDGGIIGGVKLVFAPPVYVENFRTETRLTDTEAVITVTVIAQSRDQSANLPVRVGIPGLGVAAQSVVRVGHPVSLTLTVPRDRITLWSPESPALYETHIETPTELLTDRIGYREVRTEGQTVLLNGKPIRLYGLCVHSEFVKTGRTATPDGIAWMISHAKALGCNFLRCAHYPYAEMFGRAMDEAGLLWWEEVPVYWLPTIHKPEMSRLALGMLEETIVRDWNRASLIIWSVSNECAGDAGMSFDLAGGNYPYWKRAVELVRSLDPSRLISSADSGHRRTLDSRWTPDRADEFDGATGTWIAGHPPAFYDLLDILSGNVYVAGPGDAQAYHQFVRMLAPFNKPLMISEFGSMSLLGSDDRADVSHDTLGSEARHCHVLDEAYEAFAELPEITGYMPWCLSDVRVPQHWRWYNDGKAVFRYGLLDETGAEKKAYATVRRHNLALRKQFGDQTAPIE